MFDSQYQLILLKAFDTQYRILINHQQFMTSFPVYYQRLTIVQIEEFPEAQTDLTELECRRLLFFFIRSMRWTLGILGHRGFAEEIQVINSFRQKMRDNIHSCFESINGIALEEIDLSLRTDDPKFVMEEAW
jgi:hypothetical protein